MAATMAATTTATVATATARRCGRRRARAHRRRRDFVPTDGEEGSERARTSTRAVADAIADAETRTGTYDGSVVFHVYDSLEAPKPIFNTFLEGALHVVEVSRFHPSFTSAHFHYALSEGERKIDSSEPNACFNCTLFDGAAPETVFGEFSDLVDSIEMGHLNQREHALACREAAWYTPSDDSGSSPLARVQVKRREIVSAGGEAPVFGFDESNVAVFVGVKATTRDAFAFDSWASAFGIVDAEAVVGADKFQDAALFEVVACSKADEMEHRFSHIARVSLGPVGEDADVVARAEAALREAAAKIDPDAFVASYACVYNIGKTGTPPGALPAMREIAKKKKENDLAVANGTGTAATAKA